MHDTVMGVAGDETEGSETEDEVETPDGAPLVPSAGVLVQLAERPADAIGVEDPISLEEPRTPPYAVVWIVGKNRKKASYCYEEPNLLRWYMLRDSDELIDPMTRTPVEPPPVWFYVHLLFTDYISPELLAAIEAVTPYCEKLIDEKVASVFISRGSALRRTRIALINAQDSDTISTHILSSVHTHLVGMDIYEFLYQLAFEMLREELYLPLGFSQALLMVGFDVNEANVRWYVKLSYLCAVSCQNVPEDRLARDGLEACHLQRGANAISETHGQIGSMTHRCIALLHAMAKFHSLTTRFPHATSHTVIQHIELLRIDACERPEDDAPATDRKLVMLCKEISARLIERCEFDEAEHLVQLALTATRGVEGDALKQSLNKYIELFNSGHALNVLGHPALDTDNVRAMLRELGIDTLYRMWHDCTKASSRLRLRVIREIIKEAIDDPRDMERFSLQSVAESAVII